jgi:hypothetical protein
LWPPAPNPPTIEQLDDDVIAQFGSDLLMRIQVPIRADDITAQQRQLANRLSTVATDNRAGLEKLRSYFIRRLHRPLPDLAAVAALTVTEQAMRMLPHAPEVSVRL